MTDEKGSPWPATPSPIPHPRKDFQISMPRHSSRNNIIQFPRNHFSRAYRSGHYHGERAALTSLERENRERQEIAQLVQRVDAVLTGIAEVERDERATRRRRKPFTGGWDRVDTTAWVRR